MNSDSRYLTLHVFSGTGNSLRAAFWLRDLFGADKTAVVHIMKYFNKINPPSSGDLTGLIYPTHGFTAPWAVIRHTLHLPRGNGTPAFVIAARAGTWPGFLLPGLSASAMFIVALLLLCKGYRIIGVMGLDMPSNWMSLHWGISVKNAEKIISRGRIKVSRFGAAIFSGVSHIMSVNNLVELICGILLLPVSAGYLLVGRFYLAKLFYANWNCTSCGNCAKECPINAILMKGGSRMRPFWTFSCESCMHCMAYCPERAVEASHPLAVVLFFVTSFSLAGLLSGVLIRYNPFFESFVKTYAGIMLRATVDYIYILFSFYFIYMIFYYIVKVPAINRLLTYITLTHYYRRYHESGIERKDFR